MKATEEEIAFYEKLARERGGIVRGGDILAVSQKTKLVKVQSHKAGVMNKTEAAYARRLDDLKAQGLVMKYWFESIKLRLADNTWYTPDFGVITTVDCLVEMHEVKPYYKSTGKPGWRYDARVNWKVAADLYPMF